MRRANSLNGLLAIRLQQEECEERMLASLAHQLQQTRVKYEQTQKEASDASKLRFEDVGCRADGAHHHRSDARMKQLREGLQDAALEMVRLEGAYEEQMQRYLASRRAREIISELQLKYAARWKAELRLREQKRHDELFLTRFVRD